MINFLAVDLGASSYRMILGTEEAQRELYRANDHQVQLDNKKMWDISKIYNSIIDVLLDLKRSNINVTSIAINSWGCDFVDLSQEINFDEEGYLISQIYANSYLNQIELLDEQVISKEKLFSATGIQSQSFNTLNRYKQIKHPITFIASYLNYLLTTHLEVDLTIASTSQFLDKIESKYNYKILDTLGLNPKFLPPLNDSRVTIKPIIHKNLEHIKVVFGPGHDTAYALNHGSSKSLILNIGSWIIIGSNIEEVTEFNSKYSYERGLKSKYKVVVNQPGMSAFNKLLLANGIELDFNEIYNELKSVEKCYEMSSLCSEFSNYNIDSNWTVNIASYLKDLAQLTSINIKEYIREVNPRIDNVYIVGGGSRNKFFIECLIEKLPQELDVQFGSREATVTGNLKFQKEVFCGVNKK